MARDRPRAAEGEPRPGRRLVTREAAGGQWAQTDAEARGTTVARLTQRLGARALPGNRTLSDSQERTRSGRARRELGRNCRRARVRVPRIALRSHTAGPVEVAL